MTLPTRYPAPAAEAVFSDEAKINRWMNIAMSHMYDQTGEAPPLIVHPSVRSINEREQETHHDVVAFLSLVEERLPVPWRKFLHVGLTSSDLVENAHFDALRQHANQLANLVHALRLALANTRFDVARAGRTHGQIASVTNLRHQFSVYGSPLIRIERALGEYSRYTVLKSPGPVGRGHSHRNSTVLSTQVIPRDYQLEWAALYLRLAATLESLALLVRTGSRAEIGELAEGMRVGSSAMPHKRNPVQSEKVCGLARVARGHFMAISENGALWDDRDISNSSVERIAIPDLAAVVEHMVSTMINVIQNLIVDEEAMLQNRRTFLTATDTWQTLVQEVCGLGPVAASKFIRDAIGPLVDNPGAWLGAVRMAVAAHYGVEKANEWAEKASIQWANMVKPRQG